MLAGPFEFKGLTVPAKSWNASAAEVAKALAALGVEPLRKMGAGDLPATWFFHTGQGGTGVLQISALTAEPAGMTTRC